MHESPYTVQKLRGAESITKEKLKESI